MQKRSRLGDVNAELYAALSALGSKNAPKRVSVYVESDEDIAFWRNILQPYQREHNIGFDIQLPFKQSFEKGKVPALEKSIDMLSLPQGAHAIICVDSDYDYLLQGKTERSKTVVESEYVFHTYAYSIENLQCYSESLHELCVRSTLNDKQIIDLDSLIKVYAQIIYTPLLWSIHFYQKGDTSTFPILLFCDTVKILDSRLDVQDNFSAALTDLKQRVDSKVKELENAFPADINEITLLAEELMLLGLTKDSTYLFAPGHTIKDNVIHRLLYAVCDKLREEKELEIKAHSKDIANDMGHYKKKTQPIKTVINNNTAFKSCFLYLKLQEDLDRYIQKFHSV